MYLTIEKYKELSGNITDEKKLNKLLKQSERYIDILTFNRIKNLGFNNCSEFEKEIIEEVQTDIIDFYFENDDVINSYISSYSLNGVSLDLNNTNKNIDIINGVCIPLSVYNKLSLTRFTSLIL